jgi:hypothetical protein
LNVPTADENLTLERHVLVNLPALGFVVEGFLGREVASSRRLDPRAETLGEHLGAESSMRRRTSRCLEGADPMADVNRGRV